MYSLKAASAITLHATVTVFLFSVANNKPHKNFMTILASFVENQLAKSLYFHSTVLRMLHV